MEMPQGNALCNYYILIKYFKKKIINSENSEEVWWK
jgi:hypothetical protein